MNNKLIKKALVVDDEPDICELAEITLSRMGLETRSASNIEKAMHLLATEHFDLCLTDMNLPDGDGIDLVIHIQNNYPQTPAAVITAYGNMDSAVRALKAGAFDFVSKPIDLQVLRNLVTSATKLPSAQLDSTKKQGSKTRLIGESQIIENLRHKISKLARSQAPVFIHGESGSGKELAAHLIHEQGARSDAPFVPVNCGAIPAELMESEFFGHKKGSFTGAITDKQGLFQAANGGTLFLDEVADLPLQMQVKLLRAIQEKTIRPIGQHEEQPVDVRILSASHKNLAQLVKQGQFREDLYYRINVIELEIPSLRERPEDIPLLIDMLLKQLVIKSGLDESPILSNEAMQALQQHKFPGNVRELENILERTLALAENNIIQLNDLQLPATTSQQEHNDTPATTKNNSINLAEQEKDAIITTLEQNRWNKTAAAQQLGLTLRQLRYRLQKLGID
ncbi:MAG: sigma-54 dependent transcriptional regulator [Gammaproteobacteria bacterium]|nr:sigma-54 dependent transcriptional regulator [Gammaproteobacteria bacterium]